MPRNLGAPLRGHLDGRQVRSIFQILTTAVPRVALKQRDTHGLSIGAFDLIVGHLTQA
jgi:hypothetical protein